MSDMLIKKSDEDVPTYKVFRVTEQKGRITTYQLVLTTQDLVAVARLMREW